MTARYSLTRFHADNGTRHSGNFGENNLLSMNVHRNKLGKVHHHYDFLSACRINRLRKTARR